MDFTAQPKEPQPFLTQRDLDALKAVRAAATPGDWIDLTDSLGAVYVVNEPYTNSPEEKVEPVACDPDGDDRPNDRALMCAAVNAVEQTVATLESAVQLIRDMLTEDVADADRMRAWAEARSRARKFLNDWEAPPPERPAGPDPWDGVLTTREDREPDDPTRWRPFANGTEFGMWEERNCGRCVKATPMDSCEPTCEIEASIMEAFMGDGTISMEMVERIGGKIDGIWLANCREFVDKRKPVAAEGRRLVFGVDVPPADVAVPAP